MSGELVATQSEGNKCELCPVSMKRATKKVTAHKKVKEEPKCTKQEESPPEDPVDEPPGEVKSMDPALFEGLCDGVLSALCLLQTSVSEVMDVKDEMIQENVPSCVQAQLSLSTSRLFRSLTDLYVPATELVRLVRVFGPQWEQKRVILEQLQGEHERLQRLLALTLQRVQHLESQVHRDPQSQHNKNWEKFFVRLMAHGNI
ncbi:uncharacterized protein LOC130276840 [Hyla sarda]|uniref:uncharacterized protein LOC130276840 n=1 Tax=Hyla sarda TaxID=327740 RepID=UPI0024C23C87|nr:uncharacterized protein LOC130276840 [Hyla sarda]